MGNRRALQILLLSSVMGAALGVASAEGRATGSMEESLLEEDAVEPMGLQWLAPVPGCIEKPLSQLVFAFDNKDDILILSGTGRRIARLGPRKGTWRGGLTTYASPSVHPDQEDVSRVLWKS